MSTFKKAKVVMLSTNEPSKIGNLATYQKRSLAKVIKEGINPIGSTVQFWNLYIISDDEIKENNTHFYNPYSGQLHISGNHTDYIAINKNGCKKIIATTDGSLYREESCTGYTETRSRTFYSKKPLPKPSQQFIQKYIKEYNKGNVITDILIEYEEWCNCNGSIKMRKHLRTTKCDKCIEWEELKINPKDNTITIKKVKDSYSREEVIGFGNKVKEYCKDGWKSDSLHRVFFEWDKWIEENL